jgi:hypothetical protein
MKYEEYLKAHYRAGNIFYIWWAVFKYKFNKLLK